LRVQTHGYASPRASSFLSARVSLAARRLIDRSVVPVQSEPAQVFDRLLIRPALDARAVEVFDAQDDPPAEFSGQQPVDQECARIARCSAPVGEGARRVTAARGFTV
jgi:hypothetical protein